MLRFSLLISGFMLLLFHLWLYPFSTTVQLAALVAGIVLLGIPHGAADYLVESQNAGMDFRKFSGKAFLFSYLGKIIFFALFIYFLPVGALIAFLLFSAYHFGETDLHDFDTGTPEGKFLVISYGAVLLSVLLVQHAEEIYFLTGELSLPVFIREGLPDLARLRTAILSVALCLFFISVFVYFLRRGRVKGGDRFLIHFALLVLLLYHLPLLLGFTFYFVGWHSVISLRNIFQFLHIRRKVPRRSVYRQLLLLSLLALAGMLAAGASVFLWLNLEAVFWCLIGGLAVLTAPHMTVMHRMYRHIRGLDAPVS